jgi:diguanylate cyclase (GGDEF)-like protein/PAS domain S-box-containing protein
MSLPESPVHSESETMCVPREVDQRSDLVTAKGQRWNGSRSRWKLVARHAAISSVFFATYVLLSRPEIILVSKLGFTAWYPPVGLSVALLLGLSPWYAPLVWLSDTLASALIYHQPVISWSGTVGAFGTSGLYAAAAYILRVPVRIDLALTRQRDVLRYLLVTLLAAVTAAMVNTACLVADRTIVFSHYRQAAVMWFTGDAVALVAVAPFLLLHVIPHVDGRLSAAPAATHSYLRLPSEGTTRSLLAMMSETSAQLASIGLVLWIMFGQRFGSLQLFYLAFLPILWIAMRQEMGHVVAGIFAFNFGVVMVLGRSPVTVELLTRLGLLMLAASATGLIVGSAVSERHLVRRELSARSTFLNALIENSPLGIVVLDREGRVQLCNDAFENLFLFRRNELAGKKLDGLISGSAEAETSELTSLVTAGQRVQKFTRRMRRDGSMVDIELNAVPLVVGRNVQGSFAIYKDVSEQKRAAEEEKRNAESLQRLVGELQVRTTQVTLLNEMGGLLQGCTSRTEAYGVVGQCAGKLFPVATAGALFVFKSFPNDDLEAVATWGQANVSQRTFSRSACWGLRRGVPNWGEHPGDQIMCSHLKNPVAASYLCVPMVAQSDAIGILHLQYDRSESTRGSEVFETLQESQKRLAISAAAQIALSLASLRMRETLQEQSVRDPLTGLFNRRFLEDALSREIQSAERGAWPLSLAIIDLDHFKQFNDRFGHQAGDKVLRAMADLFRSHFRSNDIVCRYGGEEFAVILPQSTAKQAAARANDLRARAKKLVLQLENRTLDRVTLSVGIAAFPENTVAAQELLRAADACLYRSKREGRDRVTVAATREPHRVSAKVAHRPSPVSEN